MLRDLLHYTTRTVLTWRNDLLVHNQLRNITWSELTIPWCAGGRHNDLQSLLASACSNSHRRRRRYTAVSTGLPRPPHGQHLVPHGRRPKSLMAFFIQPVRRVCGPHSWQVDRLSCRVGSCAPRYAITHVRSVWTAAGCVAHLSKQLFYLRAKQSDSRHQRL